MSKEKQKIVPKLRFLEFVNDGDWRYTSLGDVAEFIDSLHETPKQYVDVGYPMVRVADVKENGLDLKGCLRVTEDIYNHFTKRYIPENGDLIFSRVGSCGETVLIDFDEKVCLGQNTVLIKAKENNFFLFFYLKSTLIQNQVRSNVVGSSHKTLSLTNTKKFEVYIPKNPKEQQKIANCLSSLDTLIAAETDKLAHLKDHKKGLLQQLFPKAGETKPQYRFPEFVNDGDWEEATLGGFEDLISGDGDWILSKNIDENEKYKIVQLSSIGFGTFKDKVLKTISDDTFKKLKGTPIFKGDLLINRMVDAKKINNCIFPSTGEYVTSVDVCWIRENHYFDNYFLMNLLCTDFNQQKLLSLSSGAGRVRISKKNLFERFTFLLPTNPKEQEKIANCLSSVDDLIAAQSSKIESLQAHKKGLMQQLFPTINTN